MREESWEDHDTIQLTAQRKYLAEVQALETLLTRELSVFLTEPGSKKTNIINRITGKTYALPSTELLRLYEHLEQCRKQGALMYFWKDRGPTRVSCWTMTLNSIQMLFPRWNPRAITALPSNICAYKKQQCAA